MRTAVAIGTAALSRAPVAIGTVALSRVPVAIGTVALSRVPVAIGTAAAPLGHRTARPLSRRPATTGPADGPGTAFPDEH